MTHPLFEKHRATLDAAVQAIRTRGFWTPYPEMPSPKVYGETANEDGKRAVEACFGQDFPLDQAGETGRLAPERSPYGTELGVRYPVCSPSALVEAAQAAQDGWQRLGAEGRVGVCLEILERLNKRSFEIAHAVMLTSGQGWMMAFQAGGPHAQDRGLEAVAYAWDEMSRIPAETVWEKPQGKNPPLRMKKHFEIVGRGVALVIGCGTFPTWNTYPGFFAALATGNPVIVKPHEHAILPAAITVRIAREVLAEQGLDPNLVSLAVVTKREDTQALATHPAVKSIDFTGGNLFGEWLIDNARQAQVYAELAGVNNVVVESTDAYKAMLRNLAFTLCLYSGQMCTTTQAILVPAGGIDTDQGHKSFDEFASDLAAAIDKTLADPAVATAVLGAIQSADTLRRIDEAGEYGKVVLASRKLEHPEFPNAEVRTPVLLTCDASDEKSYMVERFGPVSFVVRVADADAAVALSERIVREHGALTVGVYSTKPQVLDAMTAATMHAGAALSINLTGAVFVNQSAAFSDYHGVGMNPAANASYADSAFVANRFRVVQRRYHVE
ncbi:phenylacetic acid degradation protein PaaN [Aromatoleum aromaticum]|uniref:PaaZ protein involved in aerobic phenylacetate metabolism n=1 Tax=Aromatoleum aromaticum (strain DSM 19018 / LMG 30748 / EbN1) TaxID=76114 RepID=Q5P3J4_AROAE|nr:phenylacetic acid degradation protein PaaN [Aromatoleum aromaticum]NMG54617.1 phenylacetic acid degradation protein PaaN [Aromatoleum aromaticum]CAI08120.1 PaaZ protein involved in aerobic phenylacetate metabolism [Aromatoleum aromaticum EbN1]